ncbi:transcriptional regulator [Streptomyces agglomeratus]|uniref:Transcriptional regulator n=1 Tax=Streptomyces agglomeratus TaxID=285458 RepID=A0A1E5PEJ7_9ACTN|nr:FMN-binding negative transcriptional regulator [Streptomyces agglomeratus]OEJ27962.1 transcriptional regulator [Streptomyces agglomeratus]OEJ37977.1 transcriptional regulator [Streptomyces agglomeratus]OEJ47640.1 transcriptional regulator [Streptomyces agglomeratus]OEJ50505.1 transcriptional regulator [Streptomyces agglomeratus]OEJ57857.1 transcriptional regulator [Streptomyces agglomeratus]
MLIHPWDAPHSDHEWQEWLAVHDFGQLAVNGLPGEAPYVQPTHFLYDAERGAHGEVLTHLARPNPLFTALEADPRVLLSVVDDYTYVPGPWQAPVGAPPEHGVPTSFYAAVQLRCTAHVVDDPAEKADLLNRQVAHFQPQGGTARAAVGEAPHGRLLSGIRGLRLEVTEVRAKFKYGSHKPQDAQERTAAGLATRAQPNDPAAHTHHHRRRTPPTT